ncbi:phosphonate ABC transporter, permease protein PhnE [Sulfitobacter sp.]|jgi:phosphonate transport system permease protein|uniref:phosphonate ABC transporter, permease protein PhnE n=1 Tax=Sulfitobacter sp. TaxID=1903071 RepID=UPI000C0FE004|nr:phosphonate ABC transporter, permease protein PhnE [Roseobacter sp.]MBV49009.1 phosphonate ABC transporter, permease protein PhnE [Roseobacter sp.]PHR03185.1 MAG: phosphonate ABC transporter, permease protein PhnE [Sulfitobacter sp.]|tara:strand:- start:4962 stop:6257 length:1296 start_codon:yes stop_codon:yes gene_type:complete
MTATALHGPTLALFSRKKMISFSVPLILIAYFVYIFFSFDIAGIGDRINVNNARTLVADAYSFKTHVTQDNRTGEFSVAIEGERKGEYPSGTAPDWVTLKDRPVVDLGKGHVITFGPQVRYQIPGYGTIVATPGKRGVNATFPAGEIPDYISASKNRVMVNTDAGRLTITRNRTEVFKYSYGWELFFFTLDSPYHGLGFGQLVNRAVNGEAGAIFHDIWTNRMWRHGDVAWALYETLLMAFLGTFGAALVALPLGFLAAKNFAPLKSIRFASRRVFDFLRGVDGLIWTIVLSRAFGPGPLTGALAILMTDTGSFGKMFSEALENIDDKQVEGVTSTGAKPLQRYRFGVIPQITPVLLSQVLYYLESNTRSATIIGAITGGGIGLMLTQAIGTQKDWEEVTYYIVLIIFMVMGMDTFSGWLRRRLIKGKDDR